MLIDYDSKPKETILYLSAELNLKLKENKVVKLVDLGDLCMEIDSKEPFFKYELALNFLYVTGKIEIVKDKIIYVFN